MSDVQIDMTPTALEKRTVSYLLEKLGEDLNTGAADVLMFSWLVASLREDFRSIAEYCVDLEYQELDDRYSALLAENANLAAQSDSANNRIAELEAKVESLGAGAIKGGDDLADNLQRSQQLCERQAGEIERLERTIDRLAQACASPSIETDCGEPSNDHQVEIEPETGESPVLEQETVKETTAPAATVDEFAVITPDIADRIQRYHLANNPCWRIAERMRDTRITTDLVRRYLRSIGFVIAEPYESAGRGRKSAATKEQQRAAKAAQTTDFSRLTDANRAKIAELHAKGKTPGQIQAYVYKKGVDTVLIRAYIAQFLTPSEAMEVRNDQSEPDPSHVADVGVQADETPAGPLMPASNGSGTSPQSEPRSARDYGPWPDLDPLSIDPEIRKTIGNVQAGLRRGVPIT